MRFIQETSSLFHLVSEKELVRVHGKRGAWLTRLFASSDITNVPSSGTFLAAGKALPLGSGSQMEFHLLPCKCIPEEVSLLRDWEACWEQTRRDGGVRDGTGGLL